MKILLITQKPPYPAIDGGCKSTSSAIESVRTFAEIYAFSLFSDKHPLIDQYYKQSGLQWMFEKIHPDINIPDAAKNLLNKMPYHIERYFDKKILLKLEHFCRKISPDFLWIDGIYMTPYFIHSSILNKIPAIYRSHNLEHKIWKDLKLHEKNFFKKQYLHLLYYKTYRWEKYILPSFHKIASISYDDTNFLRNWNQNTLWIPPAIENRKHIEPPQKPLKEKLRLGFIASFDWYPNVEGFHWLSRLLSEIDNNNTELILAGKNAPPFSHPKIKYLGYVENVYEFYRQIDAVVIPLLSGSGIKMKTIEAMSFDKPVISTKKGVEGIPAQENENFLPFNDAESLASALEKLQDDAIYENIIQNNRKLLQEYFDPDKIRELWQQVFIK
jgi:glycosyltransferase involved in cell wall biosynthesis